MFVSIRYVASNYNKLMNRHPWCTTSATSGLLLGMSDVIAQGIIEHRSLKEYDVRNTMKSIMIGCVFTGPGARTWYMILDRFVKGHTGLATVKKVHVDQLCMAPLLLAALFVLSERREDIRLKFRTSYTSTLLTNYTYWPWLQGINFYFVPVLYRSIFVHVAGLFWNSYITWMSKKDILFQDNSDIVHCPVNGGYFEACSDLILT